MEIRDVMQICQELAQRVEEQKLMAREDDRSHLIEQFAAYKRKNEETIRFLLGQVSSLRKKVGLSPIAEVSSPTPLRYRIAFIRATLKVFQWYFCTKAAPSTVNKEQWYQITQKLLAE